MTVYEIGDERIVVDAGMAFPRDEHLGVDLILPDFGYLRDKPDPRRRPDARARGSRRRAAVPDARGAGAGDLGDAADARARQVEARRARPAARGRAARGRPRRRADRARAVPASSSSAWRTRSPTRSALAIETSAGRVFHTGDWKLDHTPVDGLQDRRRPARRARQPRRRPAARRLDERRAPGLHPLGARRRRGVPPDHPGAQRARARLELRVEHPPHAAGDRRRGRHAAARSSSSAARCAAT